MNYLTTMEAAEKWGISANRITILAKGGRIPGARQIGARWMIPEDAAKPADARTSAGKAEMQQEKDAFRYPSFEFRDAASFYPPLTEEEQTLKAATEAFHAFRLREADRILGDLPEKAVNRYCRICAIYTGCMIDIYSFQPQRFLDRYGRLRAELQEEFPHRAEMEEYLHELDATLGSNDYYERQFAVQPGYPYHESFLPRLANLCAVPLSFADKPLGVADLRTHELNCIFLEKSGAYADLQAVHIYLGVAYGMLGMAAQRDFHLRRALLLAEKREMWYFVILQYYYTPRIFKTALSGFSEDFKKRLVKYSNDCYRGFARFTDALSLHSAYKLVTHEDFIFLFYAVQGLTNKEIARRLHMSVGTVGKRYGDIYALLGLKSKEQMVTLYQSSFDKNRKK